MYFKKLIGNKVYLSPIDKNDYINRTGEVGIFIGDKYYWGNGYGQQALELLLDFGFNLLNLNNIHLIAFFLF